MAEYCRKLTGVDETAEDNDEELPFTAEITETGGSIRLTVPAAIRKALRLEAGDFVVVRLKRRTEKPVVIDGKSAIGR